MTSFVARGADVLLIILGGLLAQWIRTGGIASWRDPQVFLVAFDCVLALLIFTAVGVYQSWRGKRMASLNLRVLSAWGLVLGISVVFAYALHSAERIPRGWFGSWAIITALLFLAFKSLVHFVLGRLRREGLNQKPVVIVGSGSYCSALVARVRNAPESGFHPVAIYDEACLSGKQIAGIPVISEFEKLTAVIKDQTVAELWLALPLSEERYILRLVREFRHDFINIRLVPDVRSLSLFNHSIMDLLGFPTINLAATQSDNPEMVSKLVFDRVFAFMVLLLLSPLLLAIAIAVKLDSPGPVFFKQKRMGVDGKEFSIYKFRSMRVHKEHTGAVTQATKGDSRITRTGRFLRRTSLDELPQFINVLLGDMSVVGPRPHALAHDDQYKDLVEGYMYRYRIKPGITGWAQINGFRGETDKISKMASRVKYDLYYIQNWNFWFDIKIVFLTIAKGFISPNAY
ncbi:undecaprenyl-phosphate glucose phosphotransferase [Chitinasiproducens palmae]|uniref:Putative colanic acid biosysnthesis UDP-glucose lipid carrier transferase n=1 Tax=Chitinasiproducens palmae TaxID=1770053 RepID=A0A1H2PPE9_9BURK|nr:undecaprenyl-phosphate glucose phosphotransferase [Chitinasiproducens palmae]SDV48594.1 putative colanic acid biosysnthesis UDP-glucose lipid carrier transferase [Chitinasiproducens palmae]